jgi:prephenate dehydrogenase
MVDDKAGTVLEAPLRAVPARRVAFVGLGLMGGSLAKATRRAWPSARLCGVDRPGLMEAALDAGIVDEAAPASLGSATGGVDDERAAALLGGADLVVLCLPVLSIAHALERWRGALAWPVVTDIGSTKRVVMETAERLQLPRFVGGHPMAGKSQGGLAHADADLVVGATWFLCAPKDGDPAALKLCRQFVKDLGARPVELEAMEHDRSVALTSHLPHVVANALAEAVLDGGALDAAGGSLRDVLHVAGAPFESWGDTLATNAVAIQAALADLRRRLDEIGAQIGDRDRMRDLFARGRACKERLLTFGPGASPGPGGSKGP